MTRTITLTCSMALAILLPVRLAAQCSVACPPYSVPPGPNLLKNPDFEVIGPCGSFAWITNGPGNCNFNSAAAGWKLHGDNFGHPVRSYQVGPSTLPRVCTDGSIPVDMFVVDNQDPTGGDFYIDRAEVKSVP